MKIKCLGTGSRGNCYLLDVGGNTIILDAGVQLKKIQEEVNLNDVAFAFISHEHKDHSLNREKLRKRGVEIVDYTEEQEWTIKPNLRKFSGSIDVFDVNHGETRCKGIIITHKNEKILYITDFSSSVWKFWQQFTTIIIECNYIEEFVTQEMIDADLKVKRQINTHMGLRGLMKLLDTMDLSKCEEIILVHKSTDPRLYKGHIAQNKVFCKYGKPVGIAQHYGGIDWIGKNEIFNEE